MSRPRSLAWRASSIEGCAIEFLFELLFQLLVEIIGQIIFEGVVTLGWESLKRLTKPQRESTPALAATRQFLVGACAGIVSLLIVRQRVVPRSPVPGLSLLLSPIGTGVAMHWAGEFWRERGWSRPTMFSFKAGATFAFGMALARFVYLELGWSPF